MSWDVSIASLTPVSLYTVSVSFVQVQVLLAHRAHILQTMAAAKHPVVEHVCVIGENKMKYCGLNDMRTDTCSAANRTKGLGLLCYKGFNLVAMRD